MPDLLGVRIGNIELLQNSDIRIRVHLREYPKIPPKKWVESQCNTVVITLYLIDIIDLNINSWSTLKPSDLKIEKSEDELLTVSSNGACSFNIKCKWVSLTNISAHLSVRPK
ncbi:MAG: hypothetical protein HC913_03945 [Microscillaceae bacterium]|nr:hypothetical protein [Microscillaceae bacterium]